MNAILRVSRRGMLLVYAPALLAAQQIACPTGVTVPYYGWDATHCWKCKVDGSYLEYGTEPQVASIKPGGPADGKIHDHDTLVSVDGMPITTPGAWRRLRDALPGDSLHFGLRRDGRDVATTIVAGARCANASDRAPRPEMIVRRQPGSGSRSYSMNGTLIEVDGRHDVVRYDERNKIIEISVDGVIVRVKPR